MNETIRRPDQVSPKSSPRGSRSPAYPRADSSGTLKTTISLGKNPSVIHSGPFYLVKDMGPAHPSEITGSHNLMIHYGLQNSYSKFCKKEGKEELSSFLPNLPGYIDAPGMQDNSSLRSLIENPPKTVKELIPISGSGLQGFRLHPGPLPEQYRFMSQMPKKKHKPKKRKEEKQGALQDAPDNSPDIKQKKIKTEDPPKKPKKKKKKKKHGKRMMMDSLDNTSRLVHHHKFIGSISEFVTFPFLLYTKSDFISRHSYYGYISHHAITMVTSVYHAIINVN